MYAKNHPDFTTITCFDWKKVLKEDRFKDIITGSLSYLTNAERIKIYAFVIMDNHFHLIWQIAGDHKKEDVQRDFLKFTSQQIIKILRNEKSALLEELFVDAIDRKHQVWQRNSLSIPIWTDAVMWQKIDYIHKNPVKAGLSDYPQDYHYSSALFYYNNEKRWDFLVHCDG